MCAPCLHGRSTIIIPKTQIECHIADEESGGRTHCAVKMRQRAFAGLCHCGIMRMCGKINPATERGPPMKFIHAFLAFALAASAAQAKSFITYEEFGAVGDGKTDDQNAIVAAHPRAVMRIEHDYESAKRQGPDLSPALHRIAEAQRSVNNPSWGSVGSLSKPNWCCMGQNQNLGASWD